MAARKIEAILGKITVPLGLFTFGVLVVLGANGPVAAVLLLVLGLAVFGVRFSSLQQSQSHGAKPSLGWLAVLWLSTLLLVMENLIGLLSVGVFMLPLTFCALITALLGLVVQVELTVHAWRV